MAKYTNYETPAQLSEEALGALEIARNSGKIRKGANEVIKAVERKIAKLVYIAEDVTPEEIVMYMPTLCDEKGIPYIFIKRKEELGASVGLSVGTSSAAIVEEGEAAKKVRDVLSRLDELRKGKKEDKKPEAPKKVEVAEEKPKEEEKKAPAEEKPKKEPAKKEKAPEKK